jgi:hypothetical protein
MTAKGQLQRQSRCRTHLIINRHLESCRGCQINPKSATASLLHIHRTPPHLTEAQGAALTRTGPPNVYGSTKAGLESKPVPNLPDHLQHLLDVTLACTGCQIDPKSTTASSLHMYCTPPHLTEAQGTALTRTGSPNVYGSTKAGLESKPLPNQPDHLKHLLDVLPADYTQQ